MKHGELSISYNIHVRNLLQVGSSQTLVSLLELVLSQPARMATKTVAVADSQQDAV